MKCSIADDEGREVWGRGKSNDRAQNHPPQNGGRIRRTVESAMSEGNGSPLILIIVVVVVVVECGCVLIIIIVVGW